MDTAQLQRIVARSLDLKGHIRHRLSPMSAPSFSHTRVSLTLPDPPPLAHHILSHIKWDRSTAENISNIYMHHAMEMRRDWQSAMNKAINGCLAEAASADTQGDIHAQYTSYLAAYQRALSQLMEQTANRIHACNSSQPINNPNLLKRRTPLKPDIAPFLEQMFVRNSYPTRSEKEDIAYSTGLGYRQVEVWFQNRRSRCKREGEKLRKLTFVSENASVVSLYHSGVKSKSTSPVLLPPSQGRSLEVEEERHAPIQVPRSPFQIEAAPHAFPNTFPPVCDYKPFPILDAPQTFDIPWLRHTTTERCGSKLNTDIEQLCSPLSCLVLTDEQSPAKASSSKASRWTRRLRDHVAACFPILIHPPTAPLPALVSATVTVHAATTKCSSPLPSLSKHSVRISAWSAPFPRPSSSRKSTDALPQRVPQSLQKLARDSMHPYQSGKSSRPKTRQARLSRFSSVSSISSLASDNSCSSRASSASLDSPPPSTPPSLPAVLSQSVKGSAPDLIFSPSQDLDRLFGNTDPSRRSLLAHPPQVQVVQ